MSANFIRATLLLFIIGAGGSMPNAIVSPALAIMAPTLGEGTRGIFLAQMIMSVASLTMALSAPFVGWIAERIGYRLTIMGGLIGFAAFGCVGAFTTSVPILVASRLALGLCAASMTAPACALIFYYFEPLTRERVFGLMTAATGVLSMGPAALSSVIVRDFGWHQAYLLYLFGIVMWLFAFPIITDKDGNRSPIKPPPMEKGEPIPFFAIAGVLVLAIWMAMLMFNNVVQLPFMLAERDLKDPRYVGLVLTVSSSLQVVGAILFSWFNSRLSMRYMMAMMFGLFGISHLIMGAGDTLMIILIGIAIYGFASAFTKPALASYLLRKLPPAMHGRAAGVVVTCMYCGGFVNPVVVSPISAAIGSSHTFILLGVINLVGLLIALAPIQRLRAAT